MLEQEATILVGAEHIGNIHQANIKFLRTHAEGLGIRFVNTDGVDPEKLRTATLAIGELGGFVVETSPTPVLLGYIAARRLPHLLLAQSNPRKVAPWMDMCGLELTGYAVQNNMKGLLNRFLSDLNTSGTNHLELEEANTDLHVKRNGEKNIDPPRNYELESLGTDDTDFEEVVDISGLVVDDSPGLYELRGLRMDDISHSVTVDGRLVELTRGEYSTLRMILSNQDRVLSAKQILVAIKGNNYAMQVDAGRAVRMNIMRFRRKLGDTGPNLQRHVRTLIGFGYKATEQDSTENA